MPKTKKNLHKTEVEKGNVIIMENNQKEYTQDDINNIKQITEINGNVSQLKADMAEVRTTLKEINNSLPAIRNDLNLTMTLGQTNKIEIARVENESKSRNTAVELRVTALETTNTTQTSEKKGQTHLYRNILAIIGFIGLVAGTVVTLINLFQKANG